MNAAASSEAARAGSRLKWVVLALLFGSTVLNYVDRQALSILARTVQDDLRLSDLDYAGVVQAFLLAYTLAYFVVGRLTDWLGVRIALALFVGWWSVANLLTGFVHSAAQLGSARFALGLGEAGNYTVGPKALGEHFQPSQRALAYGIYTAGAMVGATIAPPLIGLLALHYGWRAAFVGTGALGLVWMGLWFAFYRAPATTQAREAALTVAERQSETGLWRTMLSHRSVWALILARMLTDPLWYFYLFWFPKYLTDGRGLSLMGVAQVAWLVYLAADLGSVGGGVVSDRLVARGSTPAAARLSLMRWAGLLIPAGGLLACNLALPATLALAGLVAFLQLCWQVSLGSLIIDLYPQRYVASVFGLIAAGAGVGGMISTQIIGQLVTHYSYAPVFVLLALVHPAAFLVMRLVGGPSLSTRPQ